MLASGPHSKELSKRLDSERLAAGVPLRVEPRKERQVHGSQYLSRIGLVPGSMGITMEFAWLSTNEYHYDDVPLTYSTYTDPERPQFKLTRYDYHQIHGNHGRATRFDRDHRRILLGLSGKAVALPAMAFRESSRLHTNRRATRRQNPMLRPKN